MLATNRALFVSFGCGHITALTTNILFSPDSPYEIVPKYNRPFQSGDDSVDFVMLYVVKLQRHSVFFIEIKAPASVIMLSKREKADLQMRQRCAGMIHALSISTLYGISAFGTRLCFYEYDRMTRRIKPSRVPRAYDFINDVAPVERWDCDILADDGEERVRLLLQKSRRCAGHFDGISSQQCSYHFC